MQPLQGKRAAVVNAVVNAVEHQYTDMYNKVEKCGMMYVWDDTKCTIA